MAEDKRKFHERFGLDTDIDDEKSRFATRVFTSLMSDPRPGSGLSQGELENLHEAMRVLGVIFQTKQEFLDYIQGDFIECLKLLQGMYDGRSSDKQQRQGDKIQRLLDAAEVSLGVSWEDGRFLPSGAALLDERLVYDLLHWLADPKYDNIRKPYEEALKRLIEIDQKPEVRIEVVKNAYEALEAMAKMVRNNNRDLTANRQKFVTMLDVSDRYKEMLKSYVEYARDFRHAPEIDKPKPSPSSIEVESYIYMTGIFLRLGAETIRAGR